MEGRRTEELVVTDTRRPERMGVKTDSKGSVLCLTDWTSGMWSEPRATRLLSLRATYRLRCDEKAESAASDGCTETMTSLARYAILATVEKSTVSNDGPDLPRPHRSPRLYRRWMVCLVIDILPASRTLSGTRHWPMAGCIWDLKEIGLTSFFDYESGYWMSLPLCLQLVQRRRR